MTEATDILILDDSYYEEILELTHGEAAPCFQCGVCTAICPWGDVREDGFNVRSILRATQLGKFQELETLWLCSSCQQCEASCPRGVQISEVINSLRYLLWSRRAHLHTLPATLWSCYWNNNPLNQPPSARMDWAVDMSLPDFDANRHDWLIYFGCTASYDHRAQQIARATVKLLEFTNISFGVLGLAEPCCGETILRLGHRPFFEELAHQAIETFQKRGVEKMIVLSPHCFDVFIHQYQALGAKFEVQHITQFLAQLIEAGELNFVGEAEVKLAFHDPCLLGRGNGEYDAPRQILNAIPGVALLPMDQEREEGLCCGGGGGRMYLETPAGERFGDIRVQQARRTGASMLATACPLCISCLEDSMKVVEGEHLPVRDVVEIAAEHLEIR